MTHLLGSPSNNVRPFAYAAYVAGDTKVGERRVNVSLEAHPAYLLVRTRSNNQALLAIPWSNIRGLEANPVEKSYAGKAVSDLFRFVPLLQLTRASSDIEYGLTIIYWDEEVLRDQFPTFAIGDDVKRFNRLQHAILQYRDHFVSGMNQNDGVDRR